MPLSESNYLSRKVKLRQHIADAERAHAEASFRLELGEVDEAAVAKSREELAALRDRLSGLEAAWVRTQAEQEVERAAADRRAREAAIAKIDAQLEVRRKIADDMTAAAKTLAAAWVRFQKAGEVIIDAARPFALDLAPMGFLSLQNEFKGDFNDARSMVGAELVDAGLKLRANHFQAALFRSREDFKHGLAGFVERRNEAVRVMVEPIVAVEPDEPLGEAA